MALGPDQPDIRLGRIMPDIRRRWALIMTKRRGNAARHSLRRPGDACA